MNNFIISKLSFLIIYINRLSFKALSLLFKMIVAIIIGFLVDLFFRKKSKVEEHISELCEEEHCSCERHGILLSSLIHTLKISLFVLIANVVINIIIYKIGEEIYE